MRTDDGHATAAVEGTAQRRMPRFGVYVLALDTRLIWGAFVAPQVAILVTLLSLSFGLGSGESSFFALKGFASSAGSPFTRLSLANTLIDYKLADHLIVTLFTLSFEMDGFPFPSHTAPPSDFT